MAIAAAQAVLNVIKEEKLQDHCKVVGAKLLKALQEERTDILILWETSEAQACSLDLSLRRMTARRLRISRRHWMPSNFCETTMY